MSLLGQTPNPKLRGGLHPAIVTEVRVLVSDLPGLCLEIISVIVPIITSLFGEHPFYALW
jgi:hypothetical protein